MIACISNEEDDLIPRIANAGKMKQIEKRRKERKRKEQRSRREDKRREEIRREDKRRTVEKIIGEEKKRITCRR